MSNTKITSNVIESGAVTTTHIASGAISASHLTGVTTANITENTNLYYTDTRARSSISVTGGNLSYDNSTGVLQLTDSEIRDALSAGTGVTYSGGQISIGQAVGTSDTVTFGNITTTGYLRGPSNFTIDPAAYGDDTGTLIIAGNLQVDGTTTTINSTTLTVDDLNLTLASGAVNAAAANGAGITVDGASATLIYASSDDSWAVNKRFKAQSDIRLGSDGVRLSTDGNGEFGVGYGQTATNNRFTVYNNTTAAFRIKPDGKVGIGDDAPQDFLEVRGTSLGGITISNGAHNHAALSFARSSTATARIYTSEPAALHTSSLHFQTSTAASGPTLVTALTIDESQNATFAGTITSGNISASRQITVTGSTSAIQIGDTNGYTLFYTGNATNRLQLNYDAPLSTGANILMEADSSGRIVFPDQVMLAANYASAVGSGFSANSYLYVGNSSDAYNLVVESSRDITDTNAAWSARNELFIVNTHSGGEASIGLSSLSGGGQHHRAAIIATEDGTSTSTGKLAFKTRGSSTAESEKERLTIYKDGMVEMFGTKAYGSNLGLLRLRPYFTGTNYSDGAKINLVFGHEAVTNAYIGEVRVTQNNASASTASKMEFFTNSGGGNTATKPRMTIMSNGGVEVGDGTNYGYLKVINNNAIVGYFDRRNGPGDILQFRADDSPVGSIGTANGDLNINGGSGHSGIRFQASSLLPRLNGSDTNGTIDIGYDDGIDTHKFRAGYFSGQVNAATLTATNTSDATGLSFRSSLEFISGEGWCTAHGHYNYNDGTLFLNRNTVGALHPVFHIGGYNNASYHPNYSYGVGDAGMVTLTKPSGTKSEGTSYAAKGLSNNGEYSNWIKDSDATRFFDSDGLHEFHNNVDINGTLKINKDFTSNQYLWIFQNAGFDGGIVMSDNTGGSRNNWQIVPNTSSRDLQIYSYTMGAHHTLFNAGGGIYSLSDGGTSSAFFLAGNSTAAANGKVAMGLRDGMIQFRDPGDYYHKMWYYDGINVSTNSGHGHFRVWGDSGNSAMNNTSGEDILRFSIDTVTGNIGTSDGATNIYNASDERLKENVTTLPSMLNKINALRPISYDWKYKEGDTGIYGFIAQEVQEVDESLVFNSGTTGYRNDKTYGEDLELDGNIEDTLAINERKLFPMLVKAIQEQQTIIDDLKARIESLES